MEKTEQMRLPAEGLHEIPTKASAFKARVVSLAAILLAGPGVFAAWIVPGLLAAFLARSAKAAALLGDNGLSLALQVLFPVMGALGLVIAAGGLISLYRRPLTYRILRAALAIVYPLLAVYICIAWEAAFSILDANLELDGQKQDRATILLLWWHVSWPAIATMLYVAWLHVMLNSRSVLSAFTGEDGAPLKGDVVLENIRTHGQDAHVRRSFYASWFIHLLVIIIIPWLLSYGGCVESYRVPKGSGTASVVMVGKMVKATKSKKSKKTKRKHLILRPNSAIIYEIPDLDDTEVDRVMEEQTQVTYQSMAMSGIAKAGAMGKGGGTKGGWPEGMDDYKIRFIRIDHGGDGWNDGMDDSGADLNFLRAFAKSTGFKNIAAKSESHSIALLAKYSKDGFPPFVYLTGNGSMGAVSSSDRKILREYCLRGGMLIADAGSPAFHNTFIHFMSQVFPDKPLIDISDDDVLYQLPYSFPDGAPAFWHHGGRRALGIKHEGRWIVFYHPGDMNDAWKSPGYTDVTPEMRDAAMQLGVNLVYYAFNQWDDAVAKAKK